MSRKHQRIFRWRAPILLLAAAASFVSFQAHANFTGPGLFRLALGGTVTLNQDVEVLRGARIHIQNGRVMEYRDLQQLEPYCYFYSSRQRSELDQPFRVQSAQFKVEDVQRRREIVLSESVKLATLGITFLSNGGGAQYTLATRFYLNSPQQPDLTSLVCGVWADPRERGFPTLVEIQKTLGNLVKFEVPAS